MSKYSLMIIVYTFRVKDQIIILNTFELITKSVFMNSMFSITVEYHAAKIGPTIEMKTNGEMNFFDVSTMKQEGYLYGTVTYIGSDPIHWELAASNFNAVIYCDDCYVIDGTITNISQILRVYDWLYGGVHEPQSNAVTFMTCVDDFFPVVLNRESEYTGKFLIYSLAVERNSVMTGMRHMGYGYVPTAEIVNFDGPGILMTDLTIKTPVCKAYVISGPPNNSSVLLTEVANITTPYRFDRQYFSILNVDCEFDCYLQQIREN